jgi:hypothetical protein
MRKRKGEKGRRAHLSIKAELLDLIEEDHRVLQQLQTVKHIPASP